MMKELLEMLKELGEDVSVDLFEYEDDDDTLHITVEDFEGFDEDYCEIMRDYDADAVRKVQEWLDVHCTSKEDCYTMYYYFDGFEVRFGYASYDI